jgi:YD repeat-containing protein
MGLIALDGVDGRHGREDGRRGSEARDDGPAGPSMSGLRQPRGVVAKQSGPAWSRGLIGLGAPLFLLIGTAAPGVAATGSGPLSAAPPAVSVTHLAEPFVRSGRATPADDLILCKAGAAFGRRADLAYDSGGPLTSITDVIGPMSSFTCNVEGRPTSKTYADGDAVTYPC